MKRNLLLCVFMLCVMAADAEVTLFGLLKDFRSRMGHYPGGAGIRSSSRVLESGGGSAMELVRAFRALLDASGFEHETVSGKVAMSTEQLACWLPTISSMESVEAVLADDGSWRIPMTWLRCRTSLGPRLQGGTGQGIEWVDVFPSLVGSEQLTGQWAQLSYASRQDILSRARSLQPGLEGRLDGADALYLAARDATAIMLEDEACRLRSRSVLEQCGALPGYRSAHVQSLRPVRVIDMEHAVESAEAYVTFELLSADGQKLMGERRLDPQEDGVVELFWVDCDGAGDGVSANVDDGVSARCLFAQVKGVSGDAPSEVAVQTGDDVLLRFRLMSEGHCMEVVEDVAVAGERCVYALSDGFAGAVSSEAPASEDRLTWLARLLRSRLDYGRRQAEAIFGEACRNRLFGYKAALSMADDGASLENGSQVYVGACQDAVASEPLAVALLWSNQAIAGEVLWQVTGSDVESPLKKVAEYMACDGQIYETAGGHLLYGWSNVQLNVDEDGGTVDCQWLSDDGQWLSARGAKARWNMSGASWNALHDWDLAAQQGAVNELRADGLWTASPAAGRIAATGIFAEGVIRNARRCLVASLDATQKRDETGEAVAELSFQLGDFGSYQAELFNAEGLCVAAWDGYEREMTLRWNGKTDEGVVCGSGDYAFRLTIDLGERTFSEYCTLTWDVTPPEITASCQGIEQDSARTVRVAYSAEDRNLRCVRAAVLDARSRAEQSYREVEEAMGTIELPVEDVSASVFIVAVTAWDGSGNVGRREVQVQFGTLFVEGHLVCADGDAGSEKLDITAELTTPGQDGVVDAGMLPVVGRVGCETRTVRYQVRVRDSQNRLMDCKGGYADGQWRLSFWQTGRSDSEVEWTYPSRDVENLQGELASVDLSGLKSGKYTMELVAICEKTYRVCSNSFFFDNPVSIGEVFYSETDGKVQVGKIGLSLTRKYSSLVENGAFGAGWNLALDGFCCETYETRQERKNLWGETVSLRTGGSRDITLTLPDGRRTTFAFSLVPGGGLSFSYIGSWKAVTDVPWSLRATVDSNVTALPGLDPYWNCAGVGVPLDMVDFPGYILEGEDGNQYQFACERLGDYETAGDDGGSIAVSCYGQPVLSAVQFKDGRVMELTGDALVWYEADGSSSQALAFAKDEQGRIEQMTLMDGSGTVLRYRYDETGNLVEMLKGTDWAEPTVRRSYLYESKDFPHLLTGVLNASGIRLASFSCDEQGRLAGASGGDGDGMGVVHEPFASMEILTDAWGNETAMTYDKRGNILETHHADGGVSSCSYDSDGRLVERQDELGGVTRWAYDGGGRLISRTDALGNVTEYDYDSAGECCRMTDALGRILGRTMSDGGLNQTLELPSGGTMSMAADDSGQTIELSGNFGCSQRLRLQYSDDGRTYRIEDEDGRGVTTEVTHYDRMTATVHSWLDEDNDLVTARSEATVDGEGRLLYFCDSFGNVEDIQRNDDGLVVEKRDEAGRWVQYRYDALGRRVQSWTSEGYVTRHVFDKGGHLILTAGPELLSGMEEDLVFSCGTALEYDARGRCCGGRLVERPVVRMVTQGGGRYATTLLQSGTELGSAIRDYDLCGRLLREVSLTGEEHRYGYDALGRMVYSEDGAGNRTAYVRDALGNILEQTDAAGNQTRWTYDERGFVSERLDPDGRCTAMEYAQGGKLLRCAEDGLAPVVLQRDGHGYALSAAQGELAYQLEHDAYGKLLSIVDGLGHERRFVRDIQGRVVKQVSPEGRVLSWRFDNCLGEATCFDGGDGQLVECEFDNRGQWTSRRVMSGDACLRRVERQGEDEMSVEESGQVVWHEVLERDGRGRLTACIVNGSAECRYGYDGVGRIVSYESPVTAVAFGYGEDGRLNRLEYSRKDGVDLTAPVVLTSDYDGLGRVVREACLGQWEREWSYDAMGRVTAEHVDEGGQSVLEATNSYDGGGRRNRRLERRGDDVVEQTWSYDELGQLVSERHEENGIVTYDWSGSYDAAGNLVAENALKDGMREQSQHRFDGDDCLVESLFSGDRGNYAVAYAWNNLGQLVSEECTGSQQWRIVYTWSADGRLLSCEQQSGERASSVAFNYDGHGLLNGHVRRDRGDGEDLVVSHSFHHERHIHGDAARIMDYTEETSSGQSFRTILPKFVEPFHDAWGETEGDDASGICSLGEWQEASTGLVYLRSRFYSPRLRRFISADLYPVDEVQPRSFNRFAYCMNDPVNRRDPHGTMCGMLSVTGIMSQLQLAMSFSLYATITWQLGYATLLTMGNDFSYADYMLNYFADYERVKDNATIFVHGMGFHDKNWADDMIGELNAAGVDKQDYLVHLWSGFAYGPCLFIPIPAWQNHVLAEFSLTAGVASVLLKGYENINVISHSWGTVLSASVLSETHASVNTWVTMGSPLCRWSPTFACGNWLNCYNDLDPVTYAAPILYGMGWLHCPMPLRGQLNGLWQLRCDNRDDLHSCYWTEPTVVRGVKNFLNRQ